MFLSKHFSGKFFVLILTFLAVLTSCQIPPTKVKEKGAPTPDQFRTELITPKTVILDARSLFSYLNGHHPKALPVRWFDFSRDQGIHRGQLRSNLQSVADAMARLGVGLDSEVLVLGDGAYGDGSEGRVVWMLAYMGVKNVTFGRDGALTFKRKTGEPEELVNGASWKPVVDESLLISKLELKKLAHEKNKNSSLPVVFIDVRAPREYLRQSPPTDFGAMNIEWKEFIDDQGRPNHGMIAKLQAVGITKEHRIVLMSEQGVRSAMVTMALREMGFSKAVNYAGGYRDILNKASLAN